ncbi:hypothetical protein PG623_01310 [Riemerella anatipestifer]|nr:hypothetical protein [Riemerella anatipestifer]
MITIEQLAEKLNGNLWTKGNLKRIYLDRGWNTRKMRTSAFIFQNNDGQFIVSCKIECPSQPYQWIKSQEEQIKENIYSEIEDVLNPSEDEE